MSTPSRRATVSFPPSIGTGTDAGGDTSGGDPAKQALVDASAVFELVRGATLLKAVKNGKPHFRSFSLSKDLTRLTWVSPNKSAADASVLVSQMSRICRGQTTKVFESNPIPEYEHLSMSILYDTKKSLDIVFLEPRMYDVWVHGLQALVDGFSDIKAVAEVAKRVGSTKEPENLKVKVAFDNLGQAKVSFTEEACDIYTWGKGSRSVLGHGDERDQRAPEVLVALLGRNVKLLALGKLHSIALSETEGDEHGEVYSWGSGQFGRLGHGNLHDRFLPLRISTPLDSVDAAHIACGEFHSAAVGEDGRLYTWGRSSSRPCGRLGYDCASRSFKPTLVSSLSNLSVSSVACGTHHTVVLTENSQLFSFGENSEGQLGLGHTRSITAPMQIRVPIKAPDSESAVPSAIKIACGTKHTAVLFENGAVYTWGSNSLGQCGRGDTPRVLAPEAVEAQHLEAEMADVACGDTHSAFVNSGGLVFTCGDNTEGQLGLGIQQCKPEHRLPQPLSIAGVKVVQVACAYRATAALSDTGKLFTWGCGDFGQLGHGDVRSRFTPTEVQAVSDKQVKSVFCGAEHMAITVMRSWVPDDEAKNCMMCKKKFTTVRRRHHCRQCGGIFCGACTTRRFPLLDKGYSEPQRVCDKCHAILSQKQAK